MRNRRWIQETLYDLERDYARYLHFYHTTSTHTDVLTGVVYHARNVYKIKAIVMPEMILRQLYQGGTFSRVNPNFIYGATSDVKTVTLLVKEPRIEERITPNDSFVLEHERFEIKKVDKLEHRLGYMIVGTLIAGGSPYEVHFRSVSHRLDFIQQQEGIIE